MAKTPRPLPDIIIGSALLVLAVAAVVAWPLGDPPVVTGDEAGVKPVAENRPVDAKPLPAAGTVAALFGYRAPAPTAPNGRSTAAPVVQPPSIKYMGYVAGENGRSTYYFKDMRSGQVLDLHPGRDNGRGWKLVQVGPSSCTVEYNGAVFQVPR